MFCVLFKLATGFLQNAQPFNRSNLLFCHVAARVLHSSIGAFFAFKFILKSAIYAGLREALTAVRSTGAPVDAGIQTFLLRRADIARIIIKLQVAGHVYEPFCFSPAA